MFVPTAEVNVIVAPVTVIVTDELVAAQGALLIVQVSTYDPIPPEGVKVALFAAVLENCALDVFGPLVTLQAPVPVAALFAAKVAEAPRQIACAGPALDTVGAAVTVIVPVAFTLGQAPPVVETV